LLQNDKKGKRSEKATTGRTGKLSRNATQAARAFANSNTVQDNESDDDEEEEVDDGCGYDNNYSRNKSNDEIPDYDDHSES